MGKNYRFSAMQISVLCLLVMAGIFSFLNGKPYRKELGNLYPVTFYYLEKGDYTLEVTFEHSPADNEILIFSNDVIDERNQPGMVFSRMEIREGSGVVLVSLTLESGTYGVTVGTALDRNDGGYVSKAALQSNRLIHKDNYVLAAILLLSAAALGACFLKMGKDNESERMFGYPVKYMLPLFLIIIGMLASLPLFSDFLFWEDDVDFHLTRLEGIYRGLATGEFPVRITASQMAGYGGATGIMYPQLFLYPVALLRFLGVSVMFCYKVLLVCTNIGTAFAAYFAAKNVCKSRRIAVWMSVFYTFSLYRLVNLYMRGALGESLAMAFLPLVFWGAYEVLWGERRWLILVLGMTGLLGSHVLSVEMCALFLVAELVFWLASRRKEQFGRRMLDGMKAVGMTVLLNAGFLMPFLFFSGEDLQCFHLSFDLSESAAYFSQMFALFPTAGDGISLPAGTTQGEMPLTVGGALLAGAVLFLVSGRASKDREREDGIGAHCLVLGGAAVLMASWLFPWDRIGKVEALRGVFASLQFSWRFLSVATLFLSMTAAIGTARLWEKKDGQRDYKWLCGILAAVALLSVGALFDSLSQNHQQRSDKMAMEGAEYTDGLYAYRYGEYFQPIQLDYRRSEAYIRTAGGTAVEYSGYRRVGSGLYVEVAPSEKKEDSLIFPIYWYPGYRVTVNGEAVDSFSADGLLACGLPQEAAVVRVRYGGFWFFRLADAATFVALAGICGFGLYRRRRGTRTISPA